MSEVRHGRDGDAHVLRYVGDIRYGLTPSVARFVEERLVDGEPVTLLVDLTGVTFIDSTNLGHIARVGNAVTDSGGHFAIVSTRDDITELLRSMAFDQVFDVITGATGGSSEPIPVAPASREELHETILSAHRALMGMSDDNRADFEQVVAMLEAEAPAPTPSVAGVHDGCGELSR